MGVVASRFDVYLARFDPAEGLEMRKTRPCVILSTEEMNRYLGTVVVAPMTTKARIFPTRVPVRFKGRDGHVVLDQVRTLDNNRLIRRLGRLELPSFQPVLAALREMFAP